MDWNSKYAREYIKSRENPVIFDKNGKFVYFPVNKVMQITMTRYMLVNRCIIYKDNPEKWTEYFNKTNFNKLYKFGIVRHPIAKFQSAFNYLKKQKMLSIMLGMSNMNINDYVKKIVTQYNNPYLINAHFEKQYEGFYLDGRLVVDDLFKMENKNDIDKMYKKLNLKNHNYHFNRTNHIEKLNIESVSILEKIYSNDLRFLNYNSLLR